MKISLIAAMTENRVIGIDNDLPWSLPKDMKYFMETTKNHVVVMGRKNYESLPVKFRPLPNRTNLVVTRNNDFIAPDCHVFISLTECISFAKERNEQEIFIIGGGQIYELAMKFAHKIYLTEIHTSIEGGEVFFPQLDGSWEETSRVQHFSDDRHKFDFDFVIYERDND